MCRFSRSLFMYMAMNITCIASILTTKSDRSISCSFEQVAAFPAIDVSRNTPASTGANTRFNATNNFFPPLLPPPPPATPPAAPPPPPTPPPPPLPLAPAAAWSRRPGPSAASRN